MNCHYGVVSVKSVAIESDRDVAGNGGPTQLNGTACETV